MIKLSENTISKNEIKHLAKWLKTFPKLTKDQITVEFENKWSNYLGIKYSTFVNSGSSAILITLYALDILGKLNNKKIVIPSLSWATDLAPAIQLGLVPILCDCNMDDLSVDIEQLENIFKTEHPDCLILVSVLGLVPDMDKISLLCNKYNVILLEDACESVGSLCNGKKLGTYGMASVFSFYYGHHISTIEGGMVCTDDSELDTVIKMLRSHGWSRDINKSQKLMLKNKYNISDFDELYTFYIPGFNLRSTDLQAFIGLMQIDKIQSVVKARNYNYNYYQENIINEWKPKDNKNCFVSNFAYPIITKHREELIKSLIENKIETRPLICGSMHKQPFYKYVNSSITNNNLTNSEIVTKYGLYIPNHPHLSVKDLNKIVKTVNASNGGAE